MRRALVLAALLLAAIAPGLRAQPGTSKVFRHILPVDRRSSCFTGLVGTGFAHVADSLEPMSLLPERLAALWGDVLVPPTGSPDAVFLLRDYFLSETSEGFGPIGLFYLSFRVFGKGPDGRFYEVQHIDSTYRIPGSGFSVASRRFTQEMLRMLAADAFPAARVAAGAQAPSYTLEAILHIDSLEKAGLPAYAALALRPGIYRTYADFVANKPEEATIKMYPSKGGGYAAFNTSLPPDGNRQVKPGSVYAVATADKVYKSTAYAFYDLAKIGNEFFFSGLSARGLPFPVKIRGKGACGSLELLYGQELAARLYPVFADAVKSGNNLYRIDYLNGKALLVLP